MLSLMCRLAEKHTATKVAKFAESMWTGLGVRLLFFVSFRRGNGKIATTQIDFNNTLGGGASYLEKNPSYKQVGITSSDWMQHNITYYKTPTGPSPVFQPKGTTYRTKKAPVALERNKYGEPLLTDPSKGPQDRGHLQSVLRSFLGGHYRELSIFAALR
jgi:hypothetical protein